MNPCCMVSVQQRAEKRLLSITKEATILSSATLLWRNIGQKKPDI
jgi:hypothetical protein